MRTAKQAVKQLTQDSNRKIAGKTVASLSRNAWRLSQRTTQARH